MIIELCFPSQCLGCGKQNTNLCTQCIELARKSLSTPYPYIISSFDFKDPLVRKAVHAIKYHHRKDLIAPLALSLAENLKTIPSLSQFVLIPIPMPKLRKLIRGYNHAELLAIELGKLLGISVQTNALIRKRNPKRQAKIKLRTERLENQKDAFELREDIKSTMIILVDDVTTTGSTLEEAKRVILSKKKAAVYGATLAH